MIDTPAAEFVFEQGQTASRLRDSLQTIEDFLRLVPPRYTHEEPPGWPAGAWSVAMNLAHMAIYEEWYAAPVLEAMAGGDDGRLSIGRIEESAYAAEEVALAQRPIEEIVPRLRSARERQVAALGAFADQSFNVPLTLLWGQPLHSAGWVATKTFQHTWDHGNAVLQLALFAPR